MINISLSSEKKKAKIGIVSRFKELGKLPPKTRGLVKEGNGRKKGLEKKKCVAAAATPSAITMP